MAITTASVLGLFVLGAIHGMNPGMGWLLAVARGFQEGSRRGIWGALGPLAAGHGLAIAAALAAAAMMGVVLPMSLVRPLVGVALVAAGVAGFVRHRHPRGGGMQMGKPAMVTWSFMMATAHGAGLMALPLVLGGQTGSDPLAGHVSHAGAHMAGGAALNMEGILATAAHAAGYLLVTAVIAVVVYERVGLRLLRTAWINLDLFWTVALVMTGMATLVI